MEAARSGGCLAQIELQCCRGLQAYAAARMAESVLLGLSGQSVEECAYVETSIVPSVDFFAHKVS